MKLGFRTPSLSKRIAARTSIKRVIRHSLGIKAPRGLGLFTNPKKAIYNRIYNKTTIGFDKLLKVPSKPNNRQITSENMNDTYTPGIEISNTGNIIRSSSKALTVTSKNFKELRKLVTEIYDQRVELNKKLKSAKIKLYGLTFLHVLSYALIIGLFYKRIAIARTSQQLVVSKLGDKISETYVNLTFSDKSQLEKSWLNCLDTFSELKKSEKIWDLTYSEAVDKAKVRSIANTAITRTLISNDGDREIEFIKCDLNPLFLKNNNGPDLFFFPTFLLLYKDGQEFGIFDLKEINIAMKLTGYVEEERVPDDTEIIQHTWKKANKDGSADKRFKGNYQIPIVKYGEISITSESGLDESFMFSGFASFNDFAKTLEYHITSLGKLK